VIVAAVKNAMASHAPAVLLVHNEGVHFGRIRRATRKVAWLS
jgi:hypothetical protein